MLSFRELLLICPVSLRRYLWASLERAGRCLYGPRRIPFELCQRLPFGLYMKFGIYPELSREMAIMKYVASRTTIPLPTPIDFICDDQSQSSYMVMTRMPGEHADEALKRMSPHERSLLALDLRRHLEQLRSIAPPDPLKISGFDGGPCLDPCDRFMGVPGPFEDEHKFNSRLLRSVPPTVSESPIIMRAHAIKHRICLTHNDIHGRNVLVRDGRVSAILDWQGSGWFPEYWDYIISVFFVDDKMWVQLMDEIFPEYTLEMQAERLLLPYV